MVEFLIILSEDLDVQASSKACMNLNTSQLEHN